ncbi:MAG: DUF6600 domain-containing protein [Bacteroidota bacterium]
MSRLSRFALALFALLAASLALADPPARVGRLSLVENGVNFRVDRDDPGAPASINWPISSGAALETERHGRAEVWIGSTAFRVAANTQLEFPVVDDRQVSVQLLAGSLAVSIFDREQAADLTISTPEGRVSFATPGRYRIDVLSDHTALTVQAGQASFSDGERAIPVSAGQKARLYGGGQMRIDQDVDQDGFDHWVAERENAALASVSRRYVSPAMTGYQDLDRYGDWNSSPEYGAIWYPRGMDDAWAPYRFGRWVWVMPWGWTWVDQSPWGFAPFHYGRWVHARGRWGWVPGSYAVRPVYAPALVAWIGSPGWSVGFSAGSAPAVGWFPLAPREVYVPAFRATPEYVRQVNRTHVRDAAQVDRAIRSGAPTNYTYRALPQAVTVVPSNLLREGRLITPAESVRHDRRELERAPLASPAPNSALLPPGGRPFRDERQAVPLLRAPDARSLPRSEPADRNKPGVIEPRPRETLVAPLPGREDDRRRNFAREPAPLAPSSREAPVRAPEAWRGEPERRSTPPSPAPAVRDSEAVRRTEPLAPAPRPGIEERRSSPMPSNRDLPRLERENPRREMPRQERETPRQIEAAPRPREMPQTAPPPMRVAPPVQMAPQPAREAPKPAGNGRDGDKGRQREHGDEHGPR